MDLKISDIGNNYFEYQVQSKQLTVAARSKAGNVFACSNIGIMGSNPIQAAL
jgi:hypothetical protein